MPPSKVLDLSGAYRALAVFSNVQVTVWSEGRKRCPLLKQFLLGGNSFDWYRTMRGIIIPQWMLMKERFLRELQTYRHNPEYLKCRRWRDSDDLPHPVET